MITVELTPKELEFTITELQEYLSDLREEIFDTDNASYKEGLKDEQATLEAVLAKLKAQAPTKGPA